MLGIKVCRLFCLVGNRAARPSSGTVSCTVLVPRASQQQCWRNWERSRRSAITGISPSRLCSTGIDGHTVRTSLPVDDESTKLKLKINEEGLQSSLTLIIQALHVWKSNQQVVNFQVAQYPAEVLLSRRITLLHTVSPTIKTTKTKQKIKTRFRSAFSRIFCKYRDSRVTTKGRSIQCCNVDKAAI